MKMSNILEGGIYIDKNFYDRKVIKIQKGSPYLLLPLENHSVTYVYLASPNKKHYCGLKHFASYMLEFKPFLSDGSKKSSKSKLIIFLEELAKEFDSIATKKELSDKNNHARMMELDCFVYRKCAKRIYEALCLKED